MSATPVERVLAALETAGCKPRRSGKGHSARCPAHEDRNASLSIGEGDDGRALLFCHAGCTPDAICGELRLRPADMFPPREHRNGKPQKSAASERPGTPAEPTAAALIASIARKRGEPDARWDYHDDRGEHVGCVLRWNKPDGKDILPLRRDPDGWRCGATAEPRPLYRQPDVTRAETVYIVEGERAADAGRSLELCCTTSPGGAKAAGKADWRPLAGKHVVILPDRDEPGEGYAADVATLATKAGAASVRIARLVDCWPHCPAGGDLADFVEAHDAAEPDDLRRRIEAFAAAAPRWQPASMSLAACGDAWPEPLLFPEVELPEFPVSALCGPHADWVAANAEAVQVPTAMPALLSLTALGSCIARKVVVNAGYNEPVNLFTAVALGPGNRKSEAFKRAMGPLEEFERLLVEQQRPILAKERAQRDVAEQRLKELKSLYAKGKATSEQTREIDELAERLALWPVPADPTLIAQDASNEMVPVLLAENGGRLLVASAEGGLFDTIGGRYSEGVANLDAYLQGHAGETLRVRRLSRGPIFVERAALSVALAVQPHVLEQAVANKTFRGRGLLGRFLFWMPKSLVGYRNMQPSPVPSELSERYRSLVFRLAGLGGDGLRLTLTAKADRLWRAWGQEVEISMRDGGPGEAIRDWAGKLPGLTLRLAAILHVIDCEDFEFNPRPIEAETLARAIEIGRCAIPHAHYVLHRTDGEAARKEDDAAYLLRWIVREQLPEFSRRAAHQHGRRRFAAADDIDPPLQELVRRGCIRPLPAGPSEQGRPPSPRYAVNPAVLGIGGYEKRTQYPQNPAEPAAESLSEDCEYVPLKPETRDCESPAAGDDDWETIPVREGVL